MTSAQNAIDDPRKITLFCLSNKSRFFFQVSPLVQLQLVAKILRVSVEGEGARYVHWRSFCRFRKLLYHCSSRIVIKHFPWTQTCLVRVSCRCATRQIFLISGCFDSVWVMEQCIEELIDNILLDDTPSLACFFFKVVKYQLRLNVRLPWYEFESSDCRDKTVRHLLCWRQVALKIMVNFTVSYENSAENCERILKITFFICVLDLKPASLISPVRNEVWYDFYFHSGKKDSVVSRGGKGSHLDCQRIAWRRSQHRNNEQGMLQFGDLLPPYTLKTRFAQNQH